MSAVQDCLCYIAYTPCRVYVQHAKTKKDNTYWYAVIESIFSYAGEVWFYISWLYNADEVENVMGRK